MCMDLIFCVLSLFLLPTLSVSHSLSVISLIAIVTIANGMIIVVVIDVISNIYIYFKSFNT